MADIDNRLLRSYAHGPRIWDAAAIFPEVMILAGQGLIEPVQDSAAYRLTDAGRQALAVAYPGMQGSVPLPPAPDLRDVPQPPDPEDDLDEAYQAIRAAYPDLDWDGGAGLAVGRALEDGFAIGLDYEYSHPR